MPLRDVNEFRAETRIAKPSVKVRNTTAQTITTGMTTSITFDTDLWDRWGMHDTGSNTERLTCNVPGLYTFHAGLRFASNATGFRIGVIVVHDLSAVQNFNIAQQSFDASANGPVRMALASDYVMDVGDYAYVQVFQTSGGDLDIEVDSRVSPIFSAQWHSSR